MSFLRRLLHGERRLAHRPDWPAFAGADYADSIRSVAVTDRYHAKQGRSTGRWILKKQNRTLTVYLKRHSRLPLWRRLLANLWPEGDWSPAAREWANLQWARAQGIPVPPAAAFGEFLGPWFRLESFLAVEELTGMLPLHEAIPLAAQTLADQEFRDWKRRVIDQAAGLARKLHNLRCFHKDLYLCHFYTLPPPGHGDMFLIDLHRLGRHGLGGWRWQVKDLAQLLYSTWDVEGFTDQDRAWLRQSYGGGRLLWKLVEAKAALYRRHASDPRRPARRTPLTIRPQGTVRAVREHVAEDRT